VSALNPAEHRALRELYASARYMVDRWERLADRLGEEALRSGAAEARELLRELSERTAEHGLHGWPAAVGVGNRAAGLRRLGDVLLERNQALRYAVLDVQVVTTLLPYLATLADTRADAGLAEWERGWETRMRAVEDRAREAAAETGRDPGTAIQPAERGALGRAGHSLAVGIGTLGEAIDGSRAARRKRTSE
jgi:hypothetical protein